MNRSTDIKVIHILINIVNLRWIEQDLEQQFHLYPKFLVYTARNLKTNDKVMKLRKICAEFGVKS